MGGERVSVCVFYELVADIAISWSELAHIPAIQVDVNVIRRCIHLFALTIHTEIYISLPGTGGCIHSLESMIYTEIILIFILGFYSLPDIVRSTYLFDRTTE